MQKFNQSILLAVALAVAGCAQRGVKSVSEDDAARIDRTLVKEAVVYEPGSKEGAVVPDISAPRLRAQWVSERKENGRLIEAHREWLLEGDVVILGVPKQEKKR